MRAKTVRKRSRAIQYLLSADRRLRRLSLRRIRPHRKTTRNPQRSSRSHHARRTTKTSPLAAAVPTIAFVAIGFIAAGALIAARQRSRQNDVGLADSLTTSDAQPVAAIKPAFDPFPIVAARTSTSDIAQPTNDAKSKEKHAPEFAMSVTVKPSPERSKTQIAAKPAPERAKNQIEATDPLPIESAAAVVESPAGAPRSDVESPVPVTISGCLEVNDATFRLKDTAGVDAPKSRSWKSGFLMRRSARIELVDPDNALNLSGHLGQRVAATGTLVNHEMRARSLETVSASCR